MELKNVLIGGAIGVFIAYLILKGKKVVANATGCICKQSPCVCKPADFGVHFADASGNGTDRKDGLTTHFSSELKNAKQKFVDFDAADNFSKNPNDPQSQPYIATINYGSPNITGIPTSIRSNFSDPEKEVYQTSPFKH